MGKTVEYAGEFKIKAIETYLKGNHGRIPKSSRNVWNDRHKMFKKMGKTIWRKRKTIFYRQKNKQKRIHVQNAPNIWKRNAVLKSRKCISKRANRNNIRKSKKKEKYKIIYKLKEKHPIYILLKITEIKKSSYYKWIQTNKSREIKEKQDNEIIEAIKEIYIEHKGRYGIQRITNALIQSKNIKINHKKTYRLMKENGYLSVIKRVKKYIKTGKPHPKHNVIKRNFITSCPYDKLATDVTEIKMFGKKIYISPIKDLHTNRIESSEISTKATLVTVMKMIEKVSKNSIPEGTIFHSDQGGLYNSLKFQKKLEENNFIQSMSRKGTPIDNAPMESFFSTLKSEVIYNPLVEINSFEELVKELEDYIDYYNNKRIQKGLGYLTPNEFKEECLKHPIGVGLH